VIVGSVKVLDDAVADLDERREVVLSATSVGRRLMSTSVSWVTAGGFLSLSKLLLGLSCWSFGALELVLAFERFSFVNFCGTLANI